jgi:hypothetical protein
MDPLDPNYDGFEVRSSRDFHESPPDSHQDASTDSDSGDRERKDPLTYIRHAAQTIMADAGLSPKAKARDLVRLASACEIITRAYKRLGRNREAEEAAGEAKRYFDRAHELSDDIEL